MWKIVLSHAWFKCQCILMIPSPSLCNKHQYRNWLRHEDWLSKAELIWLFWKGGHLVSSWYIWITEMRTQSTFNHNISVSLSTIWGEEYIEEGEEWCERLFCLMHNLNVSAFWWYHDYHFATRINIGNYSDDCIDMIILKGRSSRKWEHNPLSIIISLYHLQQYELKKLNI